MTTKIFAQLEFNLVEIAPSSVTSVWERVEDEIIAHVLEHDDGSYYASAYYVGAMDRAVSALHPYSGDMAIIRAMEKLPTR